MVAFLSYHEYRQYHEKWSNDHTTRNAPYIHPSHDWILELWRTFSNEHSLHISAIFESRLTS